MAPPPFNFARLCALPDIRDNYRTEETQSDILDQAPVPMSGNGLGMASREEADTVDVVVCALRQLYAHIALGFRDGEGVREEERRNPLLRLAWTDFRQGNSERDRKCVAEQAVVREEICVYLRNQGAEISFLGLAESRLMYETLLKRLPFQLYHVPSFSRPDFDAPWQEDGPADSVDMATDSLVEWDGRGSLAKAVCDKLGAFRDRETGRTHYFVSNEPAVIRVRYRAPPYQAPKFRALRTFAIDDNTVFTSLEAPLNRAAHHVLIMVVRLRRSNENRDLLRRYYTDSRMVLTPSECRHADDRWSLNEPGREYMLYYARVDAIEAGIGAGLPEVAREPPPLIPVPPSRPRGSVSRGSGSRRQGPSGSQRQQDASGWQRGLSGQQRGSGREQRGPGGEQRRPSGRQQASGSRQQSYNDRSRSPLERQRSPTRRRGQSGDQGASGASQEYRGYRGYRGYREDVRNQSSRQGPPRGSLRGNMGNHLVRYRER